MFCKVTEANEAYKRDFTYFSYLTIIVTAQIFTRAF